MDQRKHAKIELVALRERINYHNYRYYILDDPEISDAEYDHLFQRLLQIENRYPELVVPESPSQRVGAPVEGGFKTVKHSIPMLSLENGFSDKEGDFYPFKLFTVKMDKNLPLALAGPLLGAPQGVIAMEKLIALGAKRIWILGWCGSLQPYLQIGDLIIPTTALPEEGTSTHYPLSKKRRQTSSFLNKRLERALLKANLPFKKGPVWTTDAIYRETEKKVADYGTRGFLAVEMEMSALITLAVYRSVKLAGLLIVSDELFSLEWHCGFGVGKLKKRSREASSLLLDLCMDER